MSDPILDGLAVAILSTDGFEQSELFEPKKALEAAGATVHVVAPESGSIKGWDEKDWGDSIGVDKTLADADPADYALLVLPGGQINPDVLRANADAVAFVKAFSEAGTPIGAICHAPWLLVEAGLAKGRKLTSYASIQTDVKNAGADWSDEEVVVCENGPSVLVTSRKPADLPAFNKALVRVAAGSAKAA